MKTNKNLPYEIREQMMYRTSLGSLYADLQEAIKEERATEFLQGLSLTGFNKDNFLESILANKEVIYSFLREELQEDGETPTSKALPSIVYTLPSEKPEDFDSVNDNARAYDLEPLLHKGIPPTYGNMYFIKTKDHGHFIGYQRDDFWFHKINFKGEVVPLPEYVEVIGWFEIG